jgi:recombination protein RecA
MAISLEKRLTEINKGLQTKFTLADEESLDIQRISTGLPNLDAMLGGGLPRKSSTIIYGQESSGKTFIALKAIAHAQSEGLECGFVDAEFSYDPVWAEKVGIQKKKLYIIQPETGEQALDATLALCKAGIDLVIVDSIAALLPTKEMEGTMEDNTIGQQARLLNQFFRKHGPVNFKTALVMINQVRAGIGGYYTSDALPAGKGQQFFSRIIVQCRRGKPIQEKGNSFPLGFMMELKTKKNKTAPPLGECTLPFYYSGKIEMATLLFQLGVDFGHIERSGAYYNYDGIRELGRENFIKALKEENKMDKLSKDLEKAEVVNG